MMTRRTRRLVGWRIGAVGALVLAALGAPARAQLYTPDPYDRTYRAYVYPPQNDGGYGQYPNRGLNYVAPNQLQRYDDLDIFSGGRYDSAYRRFDSDFGREYMPNRDVDKKYYEDRERRERDMIRAMTERDPRRREQMIRDAEGRSRRGASDPSLSPRRPYASASSSSAPTPTRSRLSSPSPSGIRSDVDETTTPAAPLPRSSRNSSGTAPSRSTTPAPTRSRSRADAPPAPLPPRRTRGSAPSTSDRSVSDVLERSRAMDRGPSSDAPSSDAPSRATRRSASPATSAPR